MSNISTKKINSTIWLILAIFIISALAYYNLTNKNQVLTNSSQPDNTNQGGIDINTENLMKSNLSLITVEMNEDFSNIYKTSLSDKKTITIFTDKDEEEKIKSVKSISKDGKLLAIMAPKEQDFVGSLYLINCDGSGKKEKIQDGFASTQDPLISPNGKMIAYTLFSNNEADYGFKLVVSNLDGSSKTEVASAEKNLTFLSWSPDDKYLSYLKGSNTKSSLIVVNINTLETKVLAEFNETVYSLDWGQKNFFAITKASQGNLNTMEIYTFTDSIDDLEQITTDELYDDFVKISPDGKYIAFYKTRYSEENPQPHQIGDIYYSDTNGSNLVKISSGSGIIGWLAN